MSPRKPKATDPQIVEMPAQRMAVVYTTGDPSGVAPKAFEALYGSVYTLKFARKKEGHDFKVGMPRSRWPKQFEPPVAEWVGIWGVPVPDDVTEVPQKAPGMQVKVETWEYGTMAQVMHIGPYDQEEPTIQRLREFVAANGYEFAGPHEEQYCSRPTAKVIKTIIRYPVRKK